MLAATIALEQRIDECAGKLSYEDAVFIQKMKRMRAEAFVPFRVVAN